MHCFCRTNTINSYTDLDILVSYSKIDDRKLRLDGYRRCSLICMYSWLYLSLIRFPKSLLVIPEDSDK